LFSFDKDILIDHLDLWLDSKRVKDFGFISHGHADHIARHRKIICSKPTADFIRIRLKNPQYRALEYNEPTEISDSKITIHPAGHILGSSQIKIETKNGSILYTGDFRISQAKTVEAFQFVKTDILIMETTFGLPHYKFPSRESMETELLELCSSALNAGKTPVVFAYTLGKGQEAVKIVSDAGLPVAVDYSILRFVPIYQKFGIEFQKFTKFKQSNLTGKVNILPVNARYRKNFRNNNNLYTIYLSGWGIDKSAQYRMGVDKVLPLSDHADYDELIQLVETIKPQKIYCTHGFDQFVDSLNNAGFSAELLK
jgi:Cft2 family RNA processing exonuclease